MAFLAFFLQWKTKEIKEEKVGSRKPVQKCNFEVSFIPFFGFSTDEQEVTDRGEKRAAITSGIIDINYKISAKK